MSHYDDHPEDLVQDTKQFLRSQYGEYIMSILQEMAHGSLTIAGNVAVKYPERYAAKYSAYKEVIDLFHAPLDADTPSQA